MLKFAAMPPDRTSNEVGCPITYRSLLLELAPSKSEETNLSSRRRGVFTGSTLELVLWLTPPALKSLITGAFVW